MARQKKILLAVAALLVCALATGNPEGIHAALENSGPAVLGRLLEGDNTTTATSTRGVPQLATSGSIVFYESGCSADVLVDRGVTVWGGPVYGGRVVLNINTGGVLGEDRLGIAPQPWDPTGTYPCPGLRVSQFALEDFGLLISPATGQTYADPALVQSCMQRVYYANNKGAAATKGTRQVTFEVYGGPNGLLPSSGTDSVNVVDLLPGPACPSGRLLY